MAALIRQYLTRFSPKPSHSTSFPIASLVAHRFTANPAPIYTLQSSTLARRRTDDQISSEWIRLVDPTGLLTETPNTTTKTLLEPARTQDVLARLDRVQYALIEVDSQASPPICKLIKRSELNAPKARRTTPSKSSKSVKEFQVTSSISLHDLEHKLKLVRIALIKSSRVKIVIKLMSDGSPDFVGMIEEMMVEIGAELIKQEREGQRIMMEWKNNNSLGKN